MSLIIVDQFSKTSTKLRSHFEKITKDDHSPDRFAWDFWNKPGRYVHLRTPAVRFFPEPLFKKIESELLAFGEEHLGCRSLSPLWLSCYVNGCEQRWHADRPHGPWAFVLSLSPEDIQFSGGETMLLKPAVLNFWNSVSQLGSQSFEENDVVERVTPTFNRLTVFDPRIPHGVSPVQGTMNPLEGRLVLHGWFTQPRPHYKGTIATEKIEIALAQFDEHLGEDLSHKMNEGLFSSSGTAAYRIMIAPTGKVSKVIALAHSLASAEPEGSYRDHRFLTTLVTDHFRSHAFPKAKTGSSLTLPLTIVGATED